MPRPVGLSEPFKPNSIKKMQYCNQAKKDQNIIKYRKYHTKCQDKARGQSTEPKPV
jgi:hypothetical protein